MQVQFHKILTIAVICWVAFFKPASGEEISAETREPSLSFQTDFYSIEMSPEQPALLSLAIDSLGLKEFRKDRLCTPGVSSSEWTLRQNGNKIEYRAAEAPEASLPSWTFEFLPRRIRVCSNWSTDPTDYELTLQFNSLVCHATLLGRMRDDGSVKLPALIHIPSEGTIRVTTIEACTSKSPGRPAKNQAGPIDSSVEGKIAGDSINHDSKDVALGYSSRRFDEDFVKVTFPAATKENPLVTYDLEVDAIYPEVVGIEQDDRFNGFRRGWLNILQLNPKQRALANHSASDSCVFTLYKYSEMARRTPPLAEGLTALDLLRETLDRYLDGMLAYGMAGYTESSTGPYDFLDSYPSLIISAFNYSQGSKSQESKNTDWLAKNFNGIEIWASKMLAMDRDGNGLIEYPLSGNSGSWPEKIKIRPANWWDTIGFGHEDAYSNALAYHACQGMAVMAKQIGKNDTADKYLAHAKKMHDAYYETFYNPETGVLAGWKSADGKLHDYYFTFVNGMAITYGLVPEDKANQIMDRMLAKMDEVGYDRFEYGLPGNLIPIRREDYVHLEKRWGGSEKEDGSDGFQIYENGGASGCYVYYTLQALYDLGRDEDAERILNPMLEAFQRLGFQGVGADGKTYDWKAWDGTPHGYEGFLVDNYLTFLAVVTRDEKD